MPTNTQRKLSPRASFSNLPVWIPKQAAKKGITLERLAQLSGISKSAIYRYLYDQDRPSEKTMLKMTRALGIEFEEGLKQYTPNKNGRPSGRKSETTREVRTKGK